VRVPHPYACDECGAPKRDVNHWWLLTYYLGGRINIAPWSDDHAAEEEVAHLCGTRCLFVRITKLIGGPTCAEEKN
jgi:hypothetical protein